MGLLLLAFSAVPTQAQTQVPVDFGDDSLPTGTRSVTWNDVTVSNQTVPHPLVDANGLATGFQLDFLPEKGFEGANTAGVTTPQGGSALAQLGWPASATQDPLYGSDNRTPVEFVLSGLDANAAYDFTLLGSRLSVSDVRSTRYEVIGFNARFGVLDASNNTSEVLDLSGVVPESDGTITIRLEKDSTNTNDSGFFYLNAAAMEEDPGAGSGPLARFAPPWLDFSRAVGKGPFSGNAQIDTKDGSTPTLTLGALDDATGIAPTWLTIPPSVTAGSPFAVTVDESPLAIGTYSATVTASTAGYPDTKLYVSMRVRAPGALNLLYYGNSYSQFNGTVPGAVSDLALEAGLPKPNTVPKLVGGQNLAFHLNTPSQAEAITEALPLGEEWDFVVLQGLSTEATVSLGDPDAFRANAVAIVGNVRAHSPNARAVLYQTWARGSGHSFYLGGNPAFQNPLDMHQQIEAGYRGAEADIDAAYGAGTALRAAAGETAALVNWDASYYDPDLSHPAPSLTFAASKAIFSRIYATRACDLSPDFSGGSGASPFVLRFVDYGLGSGDFRLLAGLADRVAPVGLRRFAGSGEDLLLWTGFDGEVFPCPLTEYSRGRPLSVRVESPAGLYAGAPAMLFGQLFPTGTPPVPAPATAELFVDPQSAQVLGSFNEVGAGQNVSLPAAPTLYGMSFLIQAQAFAPSGNTGNAFTTTDGHELRYTRSRNVRRETRGVSGTVSK